MKINDVEIIVIKGSVIEQDVDVIVNAAKTSLRGGGGIDGAIHRAAGLNMIAELKTKAPEGKPTAQPVMTHGYNLKQPYVIHVAGPIYKGGNNNEALLLEAAYRNSLKLASENNLKSIGFCSISTGLYSYPLEDAAWRAIKTAVDFVNNNPTSSIKKIVFSMYKESEFLIFTQTLKEKEINLEKLNSQKENKNE